MGIKNEQVYLHILLLTSLVIFSLPGKCLAVPAAPLAHTLTQSDGSTFQATQWGDESLHGWETIDGYSIVFDDSVTSWKYAVQDVTGNLTSSHRMVNRDPLPDNLVKHLRPTAKVQEMIPRKRLSIERQFPLSQKVVSPSGTANIPVILVNFNNTTTTYSTTDFNTLLFSTDTNSMKDYYEEVSYGAFSVSAGPGGVVGWYTALNTHDYYGTDVGGVLGNDAWPGDLVYEAVEAADATFDFAPYDQDGDGYVDVVAIVHQGTGQEASPITTDIWSHRWDLNSAYYFKKSNYVEYTTNDFVNGTPVKINDYIIQPEILNDGGANISTMGVFAHEYGHSFGLPDLYDTDGSSEGIGEWSLMASGSWNGVARSGDRPAHMDAWCKYYLGWVNPTPVSGTLTNQPIKQAETYSDVYQLLSGSPSTGTGEYFLAENRQKAGFDAGLPGAGLLIWHIDESQDSNNYECYPGKLLCPYLHYHVALEQADNLYNLEYYNNNGNSGDGGDPYPGSTNNRSFTAASSPNSNLYNGSPSNVSVISISDSGTTMTATLSAISTCTYSISPASRSFDASGGASGISVSTTAGCTWTATSNASWVLITSGNSGTGSGTVNYSVSANTATSLRTGTMTIANQLFTVTQEGIVECSSWTDVIAKYNAYAGGTATWSDVIGCYNEYALP